MRTPSLADRCASALASWFGCGFAPVAPGSAGSLAAAVLAGLAGHYLGWPPWAVGAATVAVLPLAVWSSGRAAANTGEKDPQFVVVDEVVGQWITLAGATSSNWKAVGAGFVLFRILDIWKPFPVRQLERLGGGAGIVADALMAGIYGALVLYLAGCFNLY